MKALGIIFSNIHDKNIPELVRQRTLGSSPFAGRYRLIDFALSNMVNAGIDTVGVITKRNYQSLMDHIGSGKDWDLARKDGGLIILPPYGEKDSGLYNSRLEALKGVTSFLKRADEEFVVMTDCDSVYRINFNEIIEEHIRNKADVTLMYRKCMANENNADGAITLKVDADKRVSQIKFKENKKRHFDKQKERLQTKMTFAEKIAHDEIFREKNPLYVKLEEVINELNQKVYNLQDKIRKRERVEERLTVCLKRTESIKEYKEDHACE